MNRTGFTHLITSDKNLQHQQNLEKFNVVVIILDSVNNRYELLNDFIEPIEKFLNSDFQGRVHTINPMGIVCDSKKLIFLVKPTPTSSKEGNLILQASKFIIYKTRRVNITL
jgi:hypothetical protein